jgi:hypothetical protein
VVRWSRYNVVGLPYTALMHGTYMSLNLRWSVYDTAQAEPTRCSDWKTQLPCS